jgi:hypothetical protein
MFRKLRATVALHPNTFWALLSFSHVISIVATNPQYLG